MKKLGLCFLILLLYSCIPLRIASNIEGDKIVQAKKFKKDLPNCYGFVFEDKKKRLMNFTTLSIPNTI
ncbi:hypothetical protein FVB9288_00966 [Flavobacterium sp. CECT 9288]|nr:hypothetical protein FVB9288_00966 [Flavobacterium sp. CECT 9288]